MTRWIVLSLSLLVASPAQATVLFFTGSEAATGTVSGFTGSPIEFPVCHRNANVNTTNITTQTSHTFSGGGSLNPVTGGYLLVANTSNSGDNSNCTTPTGLGQTTIFARFYLAYSIDATTQRLVEFVNVGASHFFSFNIVGTTNKVTASLDGTTAFATGTTTLTQKAWHLVELKVVVNSATVSGMEAIVDGVTEFSVFNQNASTLAAVDTVIVGSALFPPAGEYLYDDFMLCSSAYCPHGGTIARQGTSGSPTYTSWTKTGTCSGGNIEDCWSATPFSTAAAATSIVASDAQTMVVHDFATTQTGHGTQTIGNTSTINACKTAMVAKTAVASAASIRRRISGSDTDTAKTLTTSDAYYDDGIWTTTANILRNTTIEIGAVHGAGVNLDTVEDMWLICDYLNASVAPKHRVIQQ